MKRVITTIALLMSLGATLYAQLPTFEWRLENEQLTNTTTYQFDVNIYNTGSTSFEILNGTIGFLFDSVWIKNGSTVGTITLTTPSSGMSTANQVGAALFQPKTASAQPYIRRPIGNASAGSGTTVPANSMIKCFTFVLTNSVPFSTTVPPKFAWKFNTSPSAGFNYNVGGVSTAVVSNTGTAAVIANQALCYTPAYWTGAAWNTFSKTVTAGSVIATSPTIAQEATIYAGTFSGSLDVRGYNLMLGAIHVMASSEILKVRTELVNNGTLNSSTASIHFLGKVRKQTINTAIVANNIIVNDTLGVDLGGNLTINNTLNLTSGKVTIGNFNLNMGTGTISNASASSYVVTNGTGTLNMSNVGATPVTFPVGTATGYNPATLQNLAITDNFQVSVSDSIRVVAAASGYTNNAVNKTWKITENNPGTAALILNLLWIAADELPSFARSNSYVAYTNNIGKWIPAAQTAASGSSPYVQTVNGVVLNSNYSSFGVASSGTLPISLMSFTGIKKASSVELNWKTASEINAKEFQIERMENGGNFIQIGSVKAAGNTNKLTAYSFIDFTANKQSIRYYRLRMVDFDGKYKYSNTIKIADENAANEVVVYPNPTNDKISIANANLNFAAVSYKVMNLTGDVVKVGTSNINEINVSDLAAGMYMLSVIDEANEAVTVKFIKK